MKTKNPAAVALGRLGGLKGGRVKSPAKTRAARRNAKIRWAKRPGKDELIREHQQCATPPAV